MGIRKNHQSLVYPLDLAIVNPVILWTLKQLKQAGETGRPWKSLVLVASFESNSNSSITRVDFAVDFPSG
jgi:hypothetical protein